YALPRVARGMAGVVPVEARLAAHGAPAGGEVAFALVEAAVGIAGIGLDPVAVGRRVVVVVAAALADVVAGRPVVAPVRILGRRIDALGRALADDRARDGPGRHADRGADRAHRRPDRGTDGRAARGGADAHADR